MCNRIRGAFQRPYEKLSTCCAPKPHFTVGGDCEDLLSIMAELRRSQRVRMLQFHQHVAALRIPNTRSSVIGRSDKPFVVGTEHRRPYGTLMLQLSCHYSTAP